MKFGDELEKLRERVNLLDSQNIKFKHLLDSALDITNKSEAGCDVETETQFLQEAIKLIEDEKNKMQEDLEELVSAENETVYTKMKQLENDNIELRKKVDLLVNLVGNQAKDMERLKREYSEFKFLLTEPNVNAQWLKNILQLNNTFAEGTGQHGLVRQRHLLQRKIVNLESKKTELLIANESITKPGPSKKSVTDAIKSDLEKAIFKAIDTVAKKEFENLFEKVLKLEKERSKLLGQLKVVLDKSKKEIASEYYKLQQKILDIETEKAALQKTMNTLGSEEGELQHKNSGKQEMTPEYEQKISEILNAFSNSSFNVAKSTETTNVTEPPTQMNAAGGLPLCTIL
nr:unnamed protein product [Callosobruchus chinensis]